MSLKIKDAIEIYKNNGGHFFDKDTMKFWESKIESEIYEGGFFITSESDFNGEKRYYNVRQFNDEYTEVTTQSPFNKFRTFEEAEAWLLS